MSLEKQQKLSEREQQEKLTPEVNLEILDDVEIKRENEIDLKESVDTSKLNMVDIATVSPDLLDDKKIIASGNGSIKKALRDGMPNIENVSEKIIKFVTADGEKDRPSSIYHDVTETFTGPTKTYWSDRVNESKSIN